MDLIELRLKLNPLIPKDFFDGQKDSKWTEHDNAANKIFSKRDYEKGVREVLVTIPRNRSLDLNGHQKSIAKKIEKQIPEGVSVEIRILELQEYLGHFYEKPSAKQSASKNLA